MTDAALQQEMVASHAAPAAAPAESGTFNELVARVAAEIDRRRTAVETFWDFDGLEAHVPHSERTLRDLIRRGIIPAIRPPGARKFLFHPASVERALLRYTKGIA